STDSPRAPGLAHSPAQRHDLRRDYRLREHPRRGLDRLLRAVLQVRAVCRLPWPQRVSHAMGDAEVQEPEALAQESMDMAGEHGTTRSRAVRALALRCDGLFAVNGNAGWWEPCESRGSCTVLREPGGEIPPGHSPSRARTCEILVHWPGGGRAAAAASRGALSRCFHVPHAGSDAAGILRVEEAAGLGA